MGLALEATDVRKTYGSIEALKGVSLTVEEGELVGLLGPNGAGKSTLVKIACGLVRPSGGSAEVAGAPAGSPEAQGALRESLRRRVFLVIALLTVGFLALYGLGAWQAFRTLGGQEGAEPGLAGVDTRTVAAATLLGLAMFATLFLGAVLAVFLTLGAVRGDAERGLLQPLLVRPITRAQLLLGRYAAAAGVCAAYVVVVFLAAATITRVFGGWWPDRTLL